MVVKSNVVSVYVQKKPTAPPPTPVKPVVGVESLYLEGSAGGQVGNMLTINLGESVTLTLTIYLSDAVPSGYVAKGSATLYAKKPDGSTAKLSKKDFDIDEGNRSYTVTWTVTPNQTGEYTFWAETPDKFECEKKSSPWPGKPFPHI